ncbi:MAG: hypothetical protein IJF65_08460 [Clostridia bacterium]|nr:hypothetical protein [Clostridia bacterium]
MKRRKPWIAGNFFPPEVISATPRLVWYGCGKLLVEQHRGIVTYQKERLQFHTACGLVTIVGEDMELIQYGPEQAIVAGRINQISYPEEARE